MSRRRYSPAQAHKTRIEARQTAPAAGATAASGLIAALVAEAMDEAVSSPAGETYARLQYQLRTDIQALKQIQSLVRKIELKRELIHTYDAWVDGVLAAGHAPGQAPQDEVFATLMIWHIDVGLYQKAVQMAAHVLTHGLALPDRFDRTPACFIVEEIAEAAVKAYTRATEAEPADFPAEVLGELELLVECLPAEVTDMPDEVRAKLSRALGLALLAEATDSDMRIRQEAALKHYQRALDLDDRVGVKKDIERLNRDLRKDGGAPPDPSDAAPAGEADQNRPPNQDEAQGEDQNQNQTTRSSGEEAPSES